MGVSLVTSGEKGKICQYIRCAGTDSKQTIRQKTQHNQCTYNVTVRRFRLTIFAFEMQYVLTLNPLTWKIWWAPNNASRWQMGINSAFKGLNNTSTACNAHGPYYTVICGLSGSHIFPTLSQKRYDFRKNVVEHKMWVLIVLTTFVRNISHSKVNSERYCYKCSDTFR